MISRATSALVFRESISSAISRAASVRDFRESFSSATSHAPISGDDRNNYDHRVRADWCLSTFPQGRALRWIVWFCGGSGNVPLHRPQIDHHNSIKRIVHAPIVERISSFERFSSFERIPPASPSNSISLFSESDLNGRAYPNQSPFHQQAAHRAQPIAKPSPQAHPMASAPVFPQKESM